MDSERRQNMFLHAIQRKVNFTSEWKMTKLFGVSNRAILIEGGLQVGVGNLNSWTTVPQGIIFTSILRFPPADEIYFALIIKKDCNKLIERLQLMKSLGARPQEQGYGGLFDEDTDEGSEVTGNAGELRYSARNNLVVIYLADDGKIYLRNRGFWNNLLFDKSGLEPIVNVDTILFSVYPPEPSAKRNLLVRDFVGYFVRLVGREKVEEVQPWPSELNVSTAMRRMPTSINIKEISSNVQKSGGYFSGDLLERYHVAMNHLEHKHFVILAGLSGTGKTSLAKLYAFAVHGLENTNESDPFFVMCPVRPDWTDPTGLLGYYDVIGGKYIVTPFLEAILLATAHKDIPVFLCIDEMNIARAEFYFADVLSAMESRMPLHLHSNSVPLDGSRGESVPDRIELPPNLYITGTVNIDETTQPLSDKIMDRANIIDMSQIDTLGFLDNLGSRSPELGNAIAVCKTPLTLLNEKLLANGLGFGYRVMEEIVRYIAFVQRTGIMSDETALDSQITQKILVKLRGSESQRELLEQLSKLLQRYPASTRVVEDMRRQLEELGSFQNMR